MLPYFKCPDYDAAVTGRKRRRADAAMLAELL